MGSTTLLLLSLEVVCAERECYFQIPIWLNGMKIIKIAGLKIPRKNKKLVSLPPKI
jgi:hypothetical protein